MKAKLRVQRVKNIFGINDSLTAHLKDYWLISGPSWLSSQHYWWVVFKGKVCDGNWVAYAGARIHDTDTIYTGPTWVSEEFRGLGLQCRLLFAREKFARKLGIKYLISSTSAFNFYSSNSLIKSGFLMYQGWDENLCKTDCYWRKELK